MIEYDMEGHTSFENKQCKAMCIASKEVIYFTSFQFLF